MLEDWNPWLYDSKWYETDVHLSKLKTYLIKYDRGWFFSPKEGINILIGPRQVGKTTWMKQRIKELLSKGKNPLYLSCEGMTAQKLKEVLSLYLKEEPSHIFVDEISFVENWEITIKHFYEKSSLTKTKLILSGSSSSNILKKGEKLPGRISLFKRFYPLSYKEFYSLFKSHPEKALNTYFLTGGYIKALEDFLKLGTIDLETFEIYSSWIDGELSKFKKSKRIAEYILSRVVSSITSRVEWSTISSNFVSSPTVSDYMEFFDSMLFLKWINSYSEFRKSFSKPKKVYFLDPFLYHLTRFKLGMSLKIYTGILLEQSVFSNLLFFIDNYLGRNFFDHSKHIFYEKTKAGKEVDFVVKLNSLKRIEVKSKPKRIDKDTLYITLGEEGINAHHFFLNMENYLTQL